MTHYAQLIRPITKIFPISNIKDRNEKRFLPTVGMTSGPECHFEEAKRLRNLNNLAHFIEISPYGRNDKRPECHFEEAKRLRNLNNLAHFIEISPYGRNDNI